MRAGGQVLRNAQGQQSGGAHVAISAGKSDGHHWQAVLPTEPLRYWACGR